MKVLVDMNLSPTWIGFLAHHGVEATHWSSVGDPKAQDAEVMAWARQHDCVVYFKSGPTTFCRAPSATTSFEFSVSIAKR